MSDVQEKQLEINYDDDQIAIIDKINDVIKYYGVCLQYNEEDSVDDFTIYNVKAIKKYQDYLTKIALKAWNPNTLH